MIRRNETNTKRWQRGMRKQRQNKSSHPQPCNTNITRQNIHQKKNKIKTTKKHIKQNKKGENKERRTNPQMSHPPDNINQQ